MVQLGDHFDFVGLCVDGEGAGEGLPVPLTLMCFKAGYVIVPILPANNCKQTYHLRWPKAQFNPFFNPLSL